MKHNSTRAVFAYWDQCRGRRPSPERSEIEPGAIRRELGDAFILSCEPPQDARLRLAGTRICALFCREIRDETFADLFDEDARVEMRTLLSVLAEDNIGAVASITAVPERGAALDLELLLLPLRHGGKNCARMLGVLAPLQVPYWLGHLPISKLILRDYRHIGPALHDDAAPQFGVPGRPRHNFIVYDGGRD